MKIHSLENTGSISVDGVDIISLNPNGTIQLGTQTVYTAASYDEATATGGTITNQTIGNQIINGDLIVTGSLTAQQFIVSSSVTYLTTSFASGSTKFGDTLDDVHGFTGSLSISGSLIINGASYNTTTSGTSGTGGTSGSSGSSGESGIYIGTSTDTIDLSTLTVGVNKSLTTSVGLSYTIAQHVIVAYSLTQHFHGDVVSYNSGTGVLVLNVTDINTPTGTFSTWSTNLDGAAGGNGTSGTSGSSGVSGASGSSGATGSSGSAGTSGTSGTATTSTRVEQNFIATANQTTFTVTGGYTVGLVDVFVNGVRFLPTEYTATNGTTVVFNTGLMVNDEVTVLNYTSVIAALPTSRNVQDFTATAGQTTFTVTNGYIVGLLDVFVNGSKLTSSEFTATNGTTFVLTVASTLGDQVQSINYTASVNGVSGAGTTNELAYYTASSTLSSLTTSTYPSLTELSYVKGVTSSLQTQLNAKAATLSGTTNNIPKFTSSSAIGDSAITDNGTTVTLVSRALSGTSATFSSTITSQANGSTFGTASTSGRAIIIQAGSTNQAIMFKNAAGGDGTLFATGTSTTMNYSFNTYSTADALFIANGGNVGIGTSSPVDYSGYRSLHIMGAASTSSAILYLTNSTSSIRGLFFAEGTANRVTIGSQSNHDFTMITNDTERMRITSGGNVLIGTSSDNGYRLRVSGAMYGNSIYLQQTAANGGGTLTLANNDISADSGAIIGQVNFYNTDNDIYGVAAYVRAYTGSNFGVGGQLGFGTQNTWSSGTLNQRMFIDNAGNIGAPSGTNIYNASDARLKRNIVPIESGLDKVMQLNPVKFNWIEKFVESEQGKDMFGFIAQEVLPHIPEAVESFGESDLYIDGVVIENPLRINEKFIIPVLVKAIQELSAKVTLLENAQ